jgi:hypothetical protein
VVWSTPIHNPLPRRGGRAAGRGGRDAGKPHGTASSEKPVLNSGAGDGTRREKSDTGPRSLSPRRKRNGSEEESSRRERQLPHPKENGARDSDAYRSAKHGDSERASVPSNGQQNSIPRQNGVPAKSGRRGERSSTDQDLSNHSKPIESGPTRDSTRGHPQKIEGQAAPSKSASDGDDEAKASTIVDGGMPPKAISQDRRPAPTHGTVRGEGRRGSLRGGRNGVHAFHGAPQHSANSSSYYPNGTYSLPRSPTMPQDAFYHPSRGYRGQTRANSVPESAYGRYPNGYYPQAGQLPPINTAFTASHSGMFDLPGGAVPTSAFALPSQYAENVDLVSQVQIQL